VTRPQRSPGDTGQMRLAGGVIAVAMLAWLAANWAGRHYGWPVEYAFLADLAAMGALVWSLLVTWRIWRRRDQTPRER
jgi:hypothetical protein